mgnify:CR=1 FL=1
MILIIAEKPSLARNIVAGIGKMDKRDGYFENADYIVDEKRGSALLTPRGIKKVEAHFGIDNLNDPENAVISGTKENDEVVISFPEARGYYEAENYKIKVTDSKNKTVFEQTVISEYVRATDDDVRVSLGNLSAGEYTVKVDSYSPYAMHGQQLKNTITVE